LSDLSTSKCPIFLDSVVTWHPELWLYSIQNTCMYISEKIIIHATLVIMIYIFTYQMSLQALVPYNRIFQHLQLFGCGCRQNYTLRKRVIFLQAGIWLNILQQFGVSSHLLSEILDSWLQFRQNCNNMSFRSCNQKNSRNIICTWRHITCRFQKACANMVVLHNYKVSAITHKSALFNLL